MNKSPDSGKKIISNAIKVDAIANQESLIEDIDR